MSVLAAGCGVLVATGLFVLFAGVRRRVPSLSTGQSTGVWTRVRRRWHVATRRDRAVLVGGLVLGLVALGVTGIPAMVVVLPTLVIGLPVLLRSPVNPDVVTLSALDRWVRLLASSMPTGKSVPDAIRATARQAPDAIAPAVGLMIARLDDRWSTREALMAFAADLDSADADAVVAALVLAAERGGRGAVRTLLELSDSVQDRVRALREVETEREKPRVVVRQVSLITIGVVVGLGLLRPGYFAPLGSPVGQLVLLGVPTCYLAALAMMRRRTRPRRRDRLLAVREGRHVRTA